MEHITGTDSNRCLVDKVREAFSLEPHRCRTSRVITCILKMWVGFFGILCQRTGATEKLIGVRRGMWTMAGLSNKKLNDLTWVYWNLSLLLLLKDLNIYIIFAILLDLDFNALISDFGFARLKTNENAGEKKNVYFLWKMIEKLRRKF